MNETDQIIASILNVSKSQIDSINTILKDEENKIYVKLKKSNLNCPVCNHPSCPSNGSYKRTIKVPKCVLDNFVIVLNIRRYQCPSCRYSFSESLNITPAFKTISYASIIKIMELLTNPNFTFKNVSDLTGISESSVVRIFDKHCHINRGKFPEVLCIDEVFTKNSNFDSKFSCVFYDFHKHKLIDVTPSRQKRYLHMYFQKIPLKERETVKFVCIDMYLPYKQLIKIYFKKAIICVDSFHVVKHLNDDLQKIRIRIMKTYNTNSVNINFTKCGRLKFTNSGRLHKN